MSRKIIALLLATLLFIPNTMVFAENLVETSNVEQKVENNFIAPIEIIDQILEEEATNSNYEFEVATGTITKYIGSESEVIIPQTIDNVAVKSIGKNAFARNTNITKVVLNEGLEIIGEGAFSGCTKLSEIEFPNTLKRIEKGAFIKIGASSITLNEGLEYLGQQSFANCTNLENVNLPNSLKEIGNLVFANTKRANGKLSGEFIFGENLGHIGHGIFNYNATGASFKISGHGDKIYFHDEIFPEGITRLEIPQERHIMIFARAFNSNDDIYLDAGEILVSKDMSIQQIKEIINSKVILTSGAAAIKKNAQTREEDIYVESKIIWELEDLDFEEKVIKGSFEELNFGNDGVYDNYTKPDKIATDKAMEKLVPVVKLVMEKPQIEFTQEDFTYQTIQSKNITEDFFFAITGLTETGKKKIEKTKDLILPTKIKITEYGKEVEKKITGIGPKAFESMGIESVQFPDMDGSEEFVIDTAAFAGNKIKNIILPEGIKVIESFAFKGNLIESLDFPSTLVKVGSEAFKDNEIKELNISDEVELIQFDNWSFAGNKLKKVNMPYSVFKTLEFVFANNTGSDDEPGVVHLFTRNKAHLSTVTYIKNGQGQKFILVGEDATIERESLHKLFKTISQLNKDDFESEIWDELMVSQTKAKMLFADNNATKKALLESLVELSGIYDEMVSTGVNKKSLSEKVNSLNVFNEEIYTEESFKKLLQEIEKSKKLLLDSSVQQNEVDVQLVVLKEAFDKLVLKKSYIWNVEDFIYDGSIILGYSDSGKEKFKKNKNLVIPNKNIDGIAITEIGNKAFAMDIKDVILLTDFIKSPNGLKSVKIPSSIEKIGNEAFIYNAIEEIKLNEGIVEIGNRAFHSNLLREIVFPETLTKLGVATFGMNKLTSIKLNHTMKEIPDGTFTMNITLKQIEFPKNIKKIGKSAFVGARFSSVDLTGIEEIGDRAFQANQIERLVIPSTVKVISKNAFEQNKKWRRLKELILSEGVERIESSAFKSGLLTEVKLPNSIEYLDKNAFIDNMKEDKTTSIVKVYTKNPEHLLLSSSDSYEIVLVDKEVPSIPEGLPQMDNGGSSQSFVRPDAIKKEIKAQLDFDKKQIEENIINLRNEYRNIAFDDISKIISDEEKQAILELSKRGILTGTANNRIEASEGLTRASMLTILSRIDATENIANIKYINFKDVKENQWYFRAINWGVKNKIVQGYIDGSFKANNVLTLAELSSSIARYLEYKKVKLPKIYNYTEKDLINSPIWAKENILMLVNTGILRTNSNDKFDIGRKLTRGETAEIINRLIKSISNLQAS